MTGRADSAQTRERGEERGKMREKG